MVYFELRKGKQIMIGPFKSSETELRDLLKAWVAISLAFTIVTAGLSLSFGFIVIFLVSGFTVGIGFLLHELSHKVVAQRFGCFAEFRSFDQMLILAVLMSFFGFVFAAPGAVMIQGNVNVRKNGLISAAGPLMNLFLALIFLIGLIVFPFTGMLFYYGFLINSWLALFNMIPFGNFDGAKVLRWNKIVYGAMVFVAFLFMFAISLI